MEGLIEVSGFDAVVVIAVVVIAVVVVVVAVAVVVIAVAITGPPCCCCPLSYSSSYTSAFVEIIPVPVRMLSTTVVADPVLRVLDEVAPHLLAGYFALFLSCLAKHALMQA